MRRIERTCSFCDNPLDDNLECHTPFCVNNEADQGRVYNEEYDLRGDRSWDEEQHPDEDAYKHAHKSTNKPHDTMEIEGHEQDQTDQAENENDTQNNENEADFQGEGSNNEESEQENENGEGENQDKSESEGGEGSEEQEQGESGDEESESSEGNEGDSDSEESDGDGNEDSDSEDEGESESESDSDEGEQGESESEEESESESDNQDPDQALGYDMHGNELCKDNFVWVPYPQMPGSHLVEGQVLKVMSPAPVKLRGGKGKSWTKMPSLGLAKGEPFGSRKWVSKKGSEVHAFGLGTHIEGVELFVPIVYDKNDIPCFIGDKVRVVGCGEDEGNEPAEEWIGEVWEIGKGYVETEGGGDRREDAGYYIVPKDHSKWKNLKDQSCWVFIDGIPYKDEFVEKVIDDEITEADMEGFLDNLFGNEENELTEAQLERYDKLLDRLRQRAETIIKPEHMVAGEKVESSFEDEDVATVIEYQSKGVKYSITFGAGRIANEAEGEDDFDDDEEFDKVAEEVIEENNDE